MFIASALTSMLVQLGNQINNKEIPQQAPPMLFKINSWRCSSKADAFFLREMALEDNFSCFSCIERLLRFGFWLVFSSKSGI